MPIYEYVCEVCRKTFETLWRSSEDNPQECPHCQAKEIYRALTSHGGYSISGNNSASVRPKGAGAFGGKKS